MIVVFKKGMIFTEKLKGKFSNIKIKVCEFIKTNKEKIKNMDRFRLLLILIAVLVVAASIILVIHMIRLTINSILLKQH